VSDGNSLWQKKVFVIHGHDEENLERLKVVLQQRFGLRPVILREEPDGGMTLIEKFEHLAEQCCFAVVLLTPDDHVPREADGISEWRPRPNVIFELGWFCGRLGRPGVLFLCKEGTHLPSDFSAVMQQSFHALVDEPAVVKKMAREFVHKGIIRES
jgi:predicted nucleotide-binding protein